MLDPELRFISVAPVDWTVKLFAAPTVNNWLGLLVAMPMLPFCKIVNKWALVEEATTKGLTPLLPLIPKLAIGVELLIPTLPA